MIPFIDTAPCSECTFVLHQAESILSVVSGAGGKKRSAGITLMHDRNAEYMTRDWLK